MSSTNNTKNNKSKEEEDEIIIIPLECSEEDYKALLHDASTLSPDEASAELLECARYGEVDAVRAILETYPDIVNEKDTISGGNTALHKACANGHESTTRLLLHRGASPRIANSSGNTPLHWAAAAGHETIVKILLLLQDGVDVLQKNEFGRSALTEGFTSQNTNVIKLLLEHDSATEDRLLSGGGGAPVDGNIDPDATLLEDGTSSVQSTASSTRTCVVHEFDFRSGSVGGPSNDETVECSEEDAKESKSDVMFRTLLIRELPIAHADDPFGDHAVEDTTGLGIWSASLVLARWMASSDERMKELLSGKTLLELGAGCGVPGLAAALYGKPKSVYLTDLNPITVRNLQHNIDLNMGHDEEGLNDGVLVKATTIDWDDETTWPADAVDVVLGSDLIYQSSIVPLLTKVLMGVLRPDGGIFLYVAPSDGRDGLPEFLQVLKNDGQLECVREFQAPASYRANPLRNGDDDECFLHFHELASTTYILYEFRRTSC